MATLYELDSGAIAAMVAEGAFLLPAGGDAWAWHPRGSDGWDRIHQRIHLALKADHLARPPQGSPPLPEPGPAHRANDRDDPGPWAHDPTLRAWVGPGRSAFVVLSEDTWETRFGDGCFRTFEACVPDEDTATAWPLHVGYARHVRRVDLRPSPDGRLAAHAERDGFADRYEVPPALADLMGRLTDP